MSYCTYNIERNESYNIYLLDADSFNTIVGPESMRLYKKFRCSIIDALASAKKNNGVQSAFSITVEDRFYFIISKKPIEYSYKSLWKDFKCFITATTSKGNMLFNTLSGIELLYIEPILNPDTYSF